MSRKIWVVELIAKTANIPYGVAEVVVDRLLEEGVLVLGFGDKDVERIVVTFADTFGTTKVSRQDRFAAHRLAEAHTAQAVCGIIKLLGENSTEIYAPIVRSVADVENKWVSVINFVRKAAGNDTETIQT